MQGLLRTRVDGTMRMVCTRLATIVPVVALAVLFESTNVFDTVAQVCTASLPSCA